MTGPGGAARVAVQVRPEVADDLRRGAAAREARSLVQAAASLGAPLRPQHPETDDPALATWFAMELPDAAAAERAAAVLRAQDAVTAAYVKPPVRPP